jgi:hypothetical protein
MSKYLKQLFHYETKENIPPHIDMCCGDNTYEMFPDHTIIHCQLISSDGKNIKSDGSFGNELVWCKVSDQKCFKRDILYAVKIIKEGSVMFSTRASLTNWPRPIITPDSLLIDCDRDDLIDGPPWGHHGEKNIDISEIGYAQESCISDEDMEKYESLKKDLNPTIVQKKLKQKLQENMSESDATFLAFGVTSMNEHNLKMANVMAEKGMDEAVKQMFVHPTEGRQLSYAEMRSFYG